MVHIVSIKDGRKVRNAKRCLNELIELAIIKENKEVRFNYTKEYRLRRQVLIDAIKIDPPVEDHLKVKIVQHSLNELVRNKETVEESWKKFLALIKQEAQELEQKDFYVLGFLNTDLRNHGHTHIKIHGLKIDMVGWEDLSDLQVSDLYKALAVNLLPGESFPLFLKDYDQRKDTTLSRSVRREVFTPCISKVQAYDAHSAANIFENNLHLLRATLNLPSALRIFRTWGRFGKVLSKILNSPAIGVFQHDGSFVEVFGGSHPLVRYDKYDKLSKESIANALGIIDKFSQANEGDTYLFLERLLRIYQTALDTVDDRNVFLLFWQLLESLTFHQRGEKTTVDAKIATLLRLTGEHPMRDALSTFVQIRNDFVHAGELPNYVDNFALKDIVDRALVRLYTLAEDIKTEREVEEFLRYSTSNNHDLKRKQNDLKRKQNVIAYILEQRQSG